MCVERNAHEYSESFEDITEAHVDACPTNWRFVITCQKTVFICAKRGVPRIFNEIEFAIEGACFVLLRSQLMSYDFKCFEDYGPPNRQIKHFFFGFLVVIIKFGIIFTKCFTWNQISIKVLYTTYYFKARAAEILIWIKKILNKIELKIISCKYRPFIIADVVIKAHRKCKETIRTQYNPSICTCKFIYQQTRTKYILPWTQIYEKY